MDGAGARLVRAFLIADIRGYTAFTAEHGDEAGSRLAATFETITAEGVEAWSGEVIELRGDEALCAFDDPVAAIHAAVELQDAFADEVVADTSLPLHVGIGVASGSAVPLGTGFRGSTLNLAARLCAISTTGEVHASAALIEAVGNVEGLGFEVVDGLDLKGLADERRAYRVRSLAPGRSDPPAPRSSLTASTVQLPPELDTSVELVGREAEMRWLGWHWRRARHGHPRVVFVRGVAGVGKSRLVAELAVMAQADAAAIEYFTSPALAGRAAGLPAVGPGPVLSIVDGPAGAAWKRGPPPAERDRGARALTVVVGVVDGCRSRKGDSALDGLPCLEVRPMGLLGLRALATAVAPDEADELPFGRILESSAGMPGAARAAVLEWSERLAAERVAGHAAGSLPAEASSFVGRNRELQVLRVLFGQVRLLTLTGPPGTGKSRLAIELVRAVARDYDDGVYFVPLASLRDVGLVSGAIARAMQLRESPATPTLELVKAYVSERKALLLLDNFEHLAGAAPEVGALLAAAPHLKIVVTSRAMLGVSGEQVYPVPPLRLPPDEAADVEAVAACDAASLFVLRAHAADPDFELRSDNAVTVARVVSRLEGLPLAIELAAARTRTLGLDEILEHLDLRLPLLTGGTVDHEARHRTMRDAIAWSYGLLDGVEQALLCRLSVFRGGFTLDAAARVAERPELETIELVDRLLARSLLRRSERHRRGRFGMLELVREFAREELAGRQEQEAAFARHIGVYLDLVRELEPVFEGPAPGKAQDRLTPELDNLRAALERATTAGDTESSLQLAACPWRFWQGIGQLAEGRAWLERALALPGGSIPVRAAATAALGGVSYWQGDFIAAGESYRRARDLFTACGDKAAETNAVYSLSLVATYQGKLDAAERYAQEAMELARDARNESMVAEVLAAQFLIAWQKHELSRAAGLGEAALEIARRLGLSAITTTQLIGLAGVSFQQGEVDLALRRSGEALELAIETENTHTEIFALDSIASFSVSRAPMEAVRLCEAAAALNKEQGGGWTLEVMGVSCARSAARDLIEPEELERAREAGARLGLEGALELARSLVARADERDEGSRVDVQTSQGRRR